MSAPLVCDTRARKGPSPAGKGPGVRSSGCFLALATYMENHELRPGWSGRVIPGSPCRHHGMAGGAPAFPLPSLPRIGTVGGNLSSHSQLSCRPHCRVKSRVLCQHGDTDSPMSLSGCVSPPPLPREGQPQARLDAALAELDSGWVLISFCGASSPCFCPSLERGDSGPLLAPQEPGQAPTARDCCCDSGQSPVGAGEGCSGCVAGPEGRTQQAPESPLLPGVWAKLPSLPSCAVPGPGGSTPRGGQSHFLLMTVALYAK